MEEVKDAHMITQSYLKAWADSWGKVDVVDIEDRRVRPATVKSATTVEFAYRPAVLTHNVEADYGRIESQGVPVIVKLRETEVISPVERARMVAFLDMHLDRGRYANQAKILTPGLALMADGRVESINLNLADRISLSQSLPEVLRLRDLGLESWEWEVREARNLVTGDGAVLLWSTDDSDDLEGVTFPLSPTQLLVIGPGLPGQPDLNGLVRKNSRRWIVGSRGAFVPIDGRNGSPRATR